MRTPATATMGSPMLKTRTKRVLAAALVHPRASREPASERVRNAIQVLENLLEFGTLDDGDRKDVRAAIRCLWAALREIQRGNV
jgi:hypothetical protein